MIRRVRLSRSLEAVLPDAVLPDAVLPDAVLPDAVLAHIGIR
jgi:hypothetical protein